MTEQDKRLYLFGFSEDNIMKVIQKLEYRYNYIKDRYANNSRLLFIYADSLKYEIKTEDVYEDFSKIKKFLILPIIHLSQNIMMIQTN